MKNLIVQVTTFEEETIILSPSGATSNSIEEHSIWEYEPDEAEIKQLYGKGWRYVSFVSVWDWDTGEIIHEYNRKIEAGNNDK